MEEVKAKTKSQSKKSSKVLDEKVTLSNEELLEQIINKKKNKTNTPKKKSTSNNSGKPKTTKSKKVSNSVKVEVSSDDIYEKIKAKRTIKKRTVPKKEVVDNKIENKVEEEINTSKGVEKKGVQSDVSKEVEDNFNKAIKEINEENSDLIITREIRFDDLSSDLKNKKTLEELRNAIEEYDKLDGNQVEDNSLKDDIDILPSVKYSNYKIKKTMVIIAMILLIILFVIGTIFGVSKIGNELSEYSARKEADRRVNDEKKRLEAEARAEELRKEKLYNDCLGRTMTDADLTQDIVVAQNTLKDYIKENYNASVSYEDLTYGYSFNYNENTVYYAASTIKALGALYIYSNAADGKINLDDTITYTSKYKVSYSTGVSKHKLGSKIKIRDLVKYSIIYSDNSAHQMLISYIGKNKLKEFGKSLGAKNTLNGGDNFGNTSSSDGLIYMKAVNAFIESNAELGKELKSYFVESMQNEISVNNLVVAHKYGLYKKNYHNMGIVYDESTYVISIMTLEGNKNKAGAIKDISQKVYDLHNLYKTNRVNVCKSEVYGN